MRRLLTLWLCLLITLPVSAAVNDVRILIDVSGSMKANDPNNLRAPALKLLTNLIERDSRAGVWTFGRYVNMQVKLGVVNDAWRAMAEQGADDIHSRGLYTNIEDAMKRGSTGWSIEDPAYSRNMILLTDGMVDVSKDPAQDRASRNRILNQLLPQLQAAKVKVHTVALSDNADHALLRQLSKETGGRAEQVNNADELHRVFLRMFEQAAPRDTLPLKDNSFSVDGSIKEMTVLLFLAPGSPPTRLIRPNGSSFTLESKPANVRWHHEAAYDLITIKQPAAGTWNIDADIDPDNRVMVVTNLKLKTTDLPAGIDLGESLDIEASLLRDGKIITRKNFLDVVRVELIQESDREKRWDQVLSDDGGGNDQQAGDGVFTTRLSDTLEVGEHEILIKVDGVTFQRERRQLVKVNGGDPIRADVQVMSGGNVELTVMPDPDIVSMASLKAKATISDPEGRRQTFDVPRTDDGWVLTIQGLKAKGKYKAVVKATATDLQGKAIKVTLPPITFDPAVASKAEDGDGSGDDGQIAPDAQSRAEAPPSDKADKADKADPDTDDEETEKPKEKEKPESDQEGEMRRGVPGSDSGLEDLEGAAETSDWMMSGGIFAAMNILLGLVGWVVWRKLRKRDLDLDDELSTDSDEDDAEEAKA